MNWKSEVRSMLIDIAKEPACDQQTLSDMAKCMLTILESVPNEKCTIPPYVAVDEFGYIVGEGDWPTQAKQEAENIGIISPLIYRRKTIEVKNGIVVKELKQTTS